MPYDNVPKELWEDMDSCVKQVQSDQDVSKERAIAICYDSIVSNKAHTLSMSITKVSQMSDGRIRWRARANSGEVDSREERCDISLFHDFSDNFWKDQEKLTKNEPLDHPPAQLDIAHYSFYLPQEHRTRARAGYPFKVWTDGQALMMQGYFDETPLGQAAARAVQADDEDRIRVSIGFYPDWGQSGFEDGIFVYRGGRGRARLDHLALTAHPVDLEARITAGGMEMSSDELTLKQDAADVLGDEELVDELETLRATAKSGVPEGAVIKGEDETDDEEAGKSSPAPEVNMAKTKTVSGREHAMSDFLVATDAEKVDTWHLPVKVQGEPDHRLMGAAWAALHEGYRGNKYEGPNKEEAISKLKSLYESEGMELPSEKSEAKELAEELLALDKEWGEAYREAFSDGGAVSHSALGRLEDIQARRAELLGLPSGKSEIDVAPAVAEALKSFLPKIAEAIDERLNPVQELSDKVEGLEEQVKALAEEDGKKVKAALDSDDGDWLTQLIRGSTQHRNVVKGGVEEAPDPEEASDDEWQRTFGNPK